MFSFDRRWATRPEQLRLGQRDTVLLGELARQLSDRDAQAIGARPDEGDGGIERVVPVVIGLPPDHLVQQVGLQPAPYRCTGQDCVLDLAVVASPELTLWQVGLAQALIRDRVVSGGVGYLECVRGKAMNTSPGNVSFFGCKSDIDAASSNTSAPSTRSASSLRSASMRSSSVGRLRAMAQNLRSLVGKHSTSVLNSTTTFDRNAPDVRFCGC